MLGSVGDVISGNFKVLDKMAGTMEEGRVVGASPFSAAPTASLLSLLVIKVRHCR